MPSETSLKKMSAEKKNKGGKKKIIKKELARKLVPYIVILIILFTFFFDLFQVNSFVYSYSFFHNVGASFAIHQNIVRNGEYPVWLPNLMSGEPNGNVGSMISNPSLILLNYVFDPVVAFQINCLIFTIALLLGTFFAARHIFKNDEAALVVLVAVATAKMIVYSGHFAWFLYGIAFIPWVFLFMMKAFEEKNPARDSIIFSALMALQFISGGVVHLYYSAFFYVLYFIYRFILSFGFRRRRFIVNKRRLKKFFIISIIAVIVFLGLSAFRLLYFLDTVKYASNRAQGMPLQEVFSSKISTLKIFCDEMLFSNKTRYGNLNIVANILFFLGVVFAVKKRKRFPIFLAISYLVFLFIVTGIPGNLLLKIPGFDKLRVIDRFTIMNIFTAGFLAGYGFLFLKEFFAKRLKNAGRFLLPVCLIAIFAAGIIINTPFLMDVKANQENKNTIYNSEYARLLGQDDDIFRIQFAEIFGVDNHNSNLELFWHDLESTYGIFGTQWDSRYFNNYMGAAITYPDKLFGFLNVKYLIFSRPISLQGFSFYSTFNVSNNIIAKGFYNRTGLGYIYKNDNYLPRAFFLNDSVLVVGTSDLVQSGIYGMLIMLSNPSKSLFIEYSNITLSDIPLPDLLRYGVVVPVDASIRDEQDFARLSEYAALGGRVYPDVLNNEVFFNQTEFDWYLSSRNVSFRPVQILRYFDTDPNTIILNTTGLKGFVFLSEKMPLYEGWKAVSNRGEKTILRSNAIFTAVYVDGDDYVRFDFSPKWYRTGNLITIVFVVIFALSLAVLRLRAWRKPAAKKASGRKIQHGPSKAKAPGEEKSGRKAAKQKQPEENKAREKEPEKKEPDEDPKQKELEHKNPQ